MKGFYGTQTRYADDVMISGVNRASAALFLIPDIPDTLLLRNTIACAVYHSIGIGIFNEAISQRKTVSESLMAAACNNSVCFILLKDISDRQAPRYRYALDSGYTYPYVKISEYGKVDSAEKIYLSPDHTATNCRIESDVPEPIPRFFQKENGAVQHLFGCNMEKIKSMCIEIAEATLREYERFFY